MRLLVRGYNGQGFGSGFIRWFTFGSYSHVSLVFEGHDSDLEVEAIQGKGVIYHAPHGHEEKSFDEFVVDLTDEQITTAKCVALGLEGAEYDWKGIWGFLRKKKRHSEEKWFCSELVAYALWKAGRPVSRREPWRETPTSVCESFVLEPKPVSNNT